MQLSQIKEQMGLLQSRQQDVSSRRHQESEAALFEGLAAFELALEHELREPELLKLACRKLIESMRLNHKDVRPCQALAFLFLSIEDAETARDYLDLARQLDYEHPFSLALEDMFKVLRQERSESLDKPAPEAQALVALDYDEMYQHVQDQINAQIAWLVKQLPPEASLQKERIEAYEKIVRHMQTQQTEIQQQIQVVDEEIETGELVMRLKPLEKRLKNYRQALEQSQQLKLPREPDFSLEPVYDVCDTLADEIDGLEKQGVVVTPVAAHYEKLVTLAEIVAEAMDEEGVK